MEVDEDYSPSQNSDSNNESDEMTPKELAIKTFVDYLKGFLRANIAEVEAAYDSGAGWEIWLHVELYQYIVAQRGNSTGLVREPNAYPNQGQLRADFTISWGTGPIPIEIKCETERESGQAFGGRVNGDLKKVEDLPSAALVVAVALTTNARDQIQAESRETIAVGQKRIYLGYESTS